MKRPKLHRITGKGWFLALILAHLLVLPVAANPPVPNEPLTLDELIALSEEDLAKIDIAAVNLACAKGLPGAEKIDIASATSKLDQWAAYVKWQTDRHLYRLKDPKWAKAYANSEARLRMEMIVSACQNDFKVKYDEAWVKSPIFTDSSGMFIHGMLGHGNGGTCGSMPVLYVAIGRRLGYPMFLVQARKHVFCRWDGWGERVNMDGATSSGIGFEDDTFYHEWPLPMSDEDLASGVYLTSLTPTGELAMFLHTRGICFGENQRYQEAREAFAVAARLAPVGPFIKIHLDRTDRLIAQTKLLREQQRASNVQGSALNRVSRNSLNQPVNLKISNRASQP